MYINTQICTCFCVCLCVLYTRPGWLSRFGANIGRIACCSFSRQAVRKNIRSCSFELLFRAVASMESDEGGRARNGRLRILYTPPFLLLLRPLAAVLWFRQRWFLVFLFASSSCLHASVSYSCAFFLSLSSSRSVSCVFVSILERGKRLTWPMLK